jgi:hypothetical protein
MAVTDTHPQYDKRHRHWQIMRDVAAGEDAVKEAGKTYLPRLGGQDDEQYAAYKLRAGFYNATGRTVDGLSGMIFRKPPMVTAPESMSAFLDDVTLDAVGLQAFCEMCVEEVLVPGRAGIWVNFPQVEPGGITAAQAERMNLRPFWTLYTAESILDWKIGHIDNRTELVQVRLEETVTDDMVDDEFGHDEVEQIRVLELVGDGEDGTGPLYYQQRLFRKDAGGGWAQFGEPIIPKMAGERMAFIPFVFLGPRDATPSVSKPPLLDLAMVNLSHYRTEADLEHGAHFTALPTPYCFGVSENEVPDSIGPEKLWTATSKDVVVGLLEFQGQGLEALEKRRQVKEDQMAALGARMLAPEKRQAEAAETAQIHRQGEMSVLASMAMSISVGLTRALEIARDWMQLTGDVKIDLNRDFTPTPMTAQQMLALFQMVQGGRISQRTFFENLKEGEIVAPERTFEEEESEREQEVPLALLGAE